MQIRQAQIDSMQVEREKRYAMSFARELRQNAASETAHLNDAELLDAVSKAIDKARGYGVTTGRGVGAYVNLAVLVSPEFDQDPHVQEYLRRPELEIDFKIEMLARMTAAKIRENFA